MTVYICGVRNRKVKGGINSLRTRQVTQSLLTLVLQKPEPLLCAIKDKRSEIHQQNVYTQGKDRETTQKRCKVWFELTCQQLQRDQ